MMPYTATRDTYVEDAKPKTLTKQQSLVEFGYFHEYVKAFEEQELELTCNIRGIVESEEIANAATFNGLPSMVLLYRGGSKKEVVEGYGQSWSLCKDVAEFFAYNLYDTWSFWGKEEFAKINRIVYTALVPKDKIMVYNNDRQEYECILEPGVEDYIQIVEITAK